MLKFLVKSDLMQKFLYNRGKQGNKETLKSGKHETDSRDRGI